MTEQEIAVDELRARIGVLAEKQVQMNLEFQREVDDIRDELRELEDAR